MVTLIAVTLSFVLTHSSDSKSNIITIKKHNYLVWRKEWFGKSRTPVDRQTRTGNLYPSNKKQHLVNSSVEKDFFLL